MAHWPEYVERITGVPVPRLREAVRLFCAPKSAMVLTARGPEQQSKGTDTVAPGSTCALRPAARAPVLRLRLPDRPGQRQGGREHGQKADQLPGYRKLTDPAARRHVAEVWGWIRTPCRARAAARTNPRRAGHGHPCPAADGLQPRGVGAPCGPCRGAAALAGLPRGRRRGPLGDGPAGRRGAAGRAVGGGDGHDDQPGGPGPAAPTCAEPAGRDPQRSGGAARTGRPLGVEKGFPVEPQEVFDELRRATAGGPADYSGITYRRLAEENGVFWPCPAPPGSRAGVSPGVLTDDPVQEESPSAVHPGTRSSVPRPVRHRGRRARFAPLYRDSAEEPDETYPVLLTTGRVVPSTSPARRRDASTN